jgi:hypothetical protein
VILSDISISSILWYFEKKAKTKWDCSDQLFCGVSLITLNFRTASEKA